MVCIRVFRFHDILSSLPTYVVLRQNYPEIEIAQNLYMFIVHFGKLSHISSSLTRLFNQPGPPFQMHEQKVMIRA